MIGILAMSALIVGVTLLAVLGMVLFFTLAYHWHVRYLSLDQPSPDLTTGLFSDRTPWSKDPPAPTASCIPSAIMYIHPTIIWVTCAMAVIACLGFLVTVVIYLNRRTLDFVEAHQMVNLGWPTQRAAPGAGNNNGNNNNNNADDGNDNNAIGDDIGNRSNVRSSADGRWHGLW
ncbi:hypothetical protein N3K66_007847 [Trichothecium roseum]|uniref:Uncharacterized protein n=1 Tax=Trichothecium roseum TaxID=47278 RepID=A0ACC0URS4_9HYPO|nr:hypothetical protein N3K66_007847 [Trichothecium roseum]